jgi:DNA-binding response OmpR family regulator
LNKFKETLAFMAEQRKILIVEDDIFIKDIYQMRFSQENFLVEGANDGIGALEILKGGYLPDVILLDIMMPKMGGVETLKKIKENAAWKEIPIMMLTNISEKEKVAECLELGADEYIVKSHFTPSEVVGKIEVLFRNKSLV